MCKNVPLPPGIGHPIEPYADLVEPLRKLAETGDPAYAAHAGVYAGLNGVYWLSVEGPPDKDGRLPVSNLNEEGRTQIVKAHGRVEAELVHPLVRGSDVSRWSAKPSAHILFVQDPQRRRGIGEEEPQRSWQYEGRQRHFYYDRRWQDGVRGDQ